MSQPHLDNHRTGAHPGRVKRSLAIGRAAALLLAVSLIAALVVHASHGHDDSLSASQLHATCVVCQVGPPIAAQPTAIHVTADDAPICHLSIADRDHAIPPARVDVDLSRAPPSFLAS
jgi:hypothetical protein